ncbi:hypothetical protein HELRODRAFT_115984 [Helobdella robusta]|uniref:Phosphoglycolate phosphatase n=1 Tax=Helobdella robusta TaxID=6412 RepID=T1EGC3_HELRO|nr:hypothetical protein HELRODRAFT_115984 [Helobdella robusta]ESN92361.1 hypothetical protein HELRODRAFT_115984 [Helobdella robusta]
MPKKCEHLNKEIFNCLMKSINTILLDCDGVLYRGNCMVPGVDAVLNKLKSMGKRLFYVTNNSSKTRIQFSKKLASFGFPVCENNVISSSYSTAMYLRSKLNLNKDHVFCIGSDNLVTELKQACLKVVTPEIPEGVGGVEKALNYKLHPDVACVLIANDENLTYLKVAEGMRYLLSKDHECIFVATNSDSSYPVGVDILLPGAGSCVKMLETAVGRNVDVTCGKPNVTMLKAVQDEFEIESDKTLMVGDRLDTDIEFASHCSLRSLLVLTGCANSGDVTRIQNGDVPDTSVPNYYTESLADLAKYLV